jgi:large subunit ribosomal protein L29
MKKEDFSGLTIQELKEKIEQEKLRLLKLKMNHKISPIDNPASIRLIRRNIARMKTELTKKLKLNVQKSQNN